MEEWRAKLGRAGQGLMQFLNVISDAPAEVRAWPYRRRVELTPPSAAPADAAPAEAAAPAKAAVPAERAGPSAPRAA